MFAEARVVVVVANFFIQGSKLPSDSRRILLHKKRKKKRGGGEKKDIEKC